MRSSGTPRVQVTLPILVCLLCLALPAGAQQPVGEAPLPPAATELHPGLGDTHFPITTAVPGAQVYFDQGMALLYGFNHDEAARYFRRAAELDPAAAMPYWGVAMAIGPNYNDTAVDENRARATRDAVDSALARRAAASPREQAYIDALALRYPSADPDTDWLARHLIYSDAMRELVARFPDDLDAATYFAESLMMLRPWLLWSADGEPAPGTLELVAVLESVLRRDPNHPGANHFYIHAVEASPNLERAIPSAQRLMTLVPGAGHLVHMPGHIYLQTGDYELAAATNVNAIAADDAFIARTRTSDSIYALMYATHNVHFVAYARAQQGRYAEARAAAEEMLARTGDFDLEMQMLEAFRLFPAQIDLRFRRWDVLLAAAEPSAERPYSHAFWRYGRAIAYAGTGDLGAAEAEQRRFEGEREALPEELMHLLNNRAGDMLALASATLRAEIAAARGDATLAIAEWRRAVEAERSVLYDEPPAWIDPVRQSLGAALLEDGQAEAAEAVFRETLAKHVRDGRLLYGLWQSLLAQGRDDEAALVEAQYREAWADATAPLALGDL